jgi:hypothetical protein
MRGCALMETVQRSALVVASALFVASLAGCTAPDEASPTTSTAPDDIVSMGAGSTALPSDGPGTTMDRQPRSIPSGTPSMPATQSTAPEHLVRPIIDLPGCTPSWALERSGPVTLFARPSSAPLPVQLLASAPDDLTAPYAVVERFFADQRASGGPRDSVDVNGQPARVHVGEHGQGEVQWLLPDGTEAYLRSRGFSQDQLVEIARALQPRPTNAAVPGFDLAPPAPMGLTIVDETTQLSGDSTSTSCTLATGVRVTAVFLRGDPVFQFAVALDWSPLPTLTRVGGEIVSIVAPTADAETVARALKNTTAEQWHVLLHASATSLATDAASPP